MTRVADGAWTKGRSAESIEYHRLVIKATARAKQRLCEQYPKQYAKLLREERKALGVHGSMKLVPARNDGARDGG